MTATSAPLPLDGVRIIDITTAAAGPFAAGLLSMLGASIVRIGRIQDYGTARRASSFTHTIQPQGSGMYFDSNINKRNILIDLKSEEGIAIVKRLSRLAHGVMDSYRAGVLDRLGIGYEALSADNPRLVMVSLTSGGASGPDKNDRGYAAVFSALSGFSELMGYEDGPPVELRIQSDLISGTMGAYAMLAGLVRARYSGRGQFIDSSNREMLSMFIGEALVDFFVNKRNQTRHGNQHFAWAPHDVYPCAGDDRWISIAVTDDNQWRALANLIGGEQLMQDERFADGFLRWRNLEQLNRLIGSWTIQFEDRELMLKLQAAGVPATQVMYPEDVLADPHIQARNWFRVVEAGERPHIVAGRTPWLFSKTSGERFERGDEPGESTDVILQELGYTSDEIAGLREREVVA